MTTGKGRGEAGGSGLGSLLSGSWDQMSFNASTDFKSHDSITSASCSRNYSFQV